MTLMTLEANKLAIQVRPSDDLNDLNDP